MYLRGQAAKEFEVQRVGEREAFGGRGAVDDRRRELYIEYCMPPPPWICWPEQFSLGLEWKLAVLLGEEPARFSASELRRLRCALECAHMPCVESSCARAFRHAAAAPRLHEPHLLASLGAR